MTRFFTAAVCSIFSGNLLITLIEKMMNSGESLQQLHEVLLTAESKAAAAAAYPHELLTSKIVAWAIGAFVAGLVLSIMDKTANKWLRVGVVMFYLCAAYINIAIVPHPAWMAATIPAMFIVPFAGGASLTKMIQELKQLPFFENRKNDEALTNQPYNII